MSVVSSSLGVKLLGAGTALPRAPAIDNASLLRKLPALAGRSPAALAAIGEGIKRQFGFSHRHLTHVPGEAFTDDEETSESLAASAAAAALGGKAPSALILGSTTSCRYAGSQASAVLGGLGHAAPAVEMRAGCSTSLASLHTALLWLMAGYPDALVVCAETMSKIADPAQVEHAIGLADGAGAVWLGRAAPGQADFTIDKSYFSTEGVFADLYTTRGRLPPTAAAIGAGQYYLEGDGERMRELARERYVRLIETLLPDAAERQRLAWVVPHQVSLPLIRVVLEATGVTAPVVWDADAVGNLGGASIAYSAAKALGEGRFRPGDRVLLLSVGGGLSLAAQLWTFAGGASR